MAVVLFLYFDVYVTQAEYELAEIKLGVRFAGEERTNREEDSLC